MNLRLPACTTNTPSSNSSKPSKIGWVVAVCIAVGVGIGAASILVNPLFLIAGALVLPLALWLVRSVDRMLLALVVVIGLLPRFASPVRLGGFTPTFLDAALIGFLVAWFATRSRAVPQIPIAVPLIGLIAVAIATFIVGLPNGALTPLVLRRFAEMLLSLMTVWVLVAAWPTLESQNKFVRLIVIVGALSAFIGIIFYVMPDELAIRLLSALRVFGYPEGADVLRFILDDPAQMQRATGLWIDPNAFGGFLLLAGAITLPQLFAPKPVVPRPWVVICLGLIGLTLVLTVSRGAMLGLVLAALIIGGLKYRKLLLLGIFVLLLVLVLPQTRSLVAHFADGFAGQDLATQMRFGEYKDALRLIERYPLFGVGFIDAPDIDLYIGVSSMYLLVTQQMGLLGAAAFLGVLIAVFVSAARAWPTVRQHADWVPVWLGAHAALAGALFSGIFDHYFFNIDFHVSVMLFWAVIALAQASTLLATNSLASQTENGVPSADSSR